MPLQHFSTSRLGGDPSCSACGAGKTLSFNWKLAQAANKPEHRRDLTVFVHPKSLRWGTLFRCKNCDQPWYLDGDEQSMRCVPRDRLDLIERWNREPIKLHGEHVKTLASIGCTPPDIYGNGSEFHQTPCSVVTKTGERFDTAIVTFQRHPPIEESRQYRLASEIREIHASPYALPLDVRIATTKAVELRMGFAPTLVRTPNGELVILNWTQNFFHKPGCLAGDVVLANEWIDWDNMPEVYPASEEITFFVADVEFSP